MMQKLYTPEEVADHLKINPETVRKWLRSGRLGGVNTSAGWRVTEQDVEDWLDGERQRQHERNLEK